MHAPLVGEHRREGAADLEDVGRLLRDPPGVLAAVAVVVVAVADPVQRRGVDAVAPHVHQQRRRRRRRWRSRCGGGTRRAQMLEILAADLQPVVAAARDGGALLEIERFGRPGDGRCGIERGASGGRGAEPDHVGVDLAVHRVGRRLGIGLAPAEPAGDLHPSIGGSDHEDRAVGERGESGPVVEDVVGAMDIDRLQPTLARVAGHVLDPDRAVPAPERRLLGAIGEPDAPGLIGGEPRIALGVLRASDPALFAFLASGAGGGLAPAGEHGGLESRRRARVPGRRRSSARRCAASAAVERCSLVLHRGAEVFAPAFRAFLPRDPEAPGGIVRGAPDALPERATRRRRSQKRTARRSWTWRRRHRNCRARTSPTPRRHRRRRTRRLRGPIRWRDRPRRRVRA